MLIVGPHLSTSKGFLAAAKEAVAIEANTFQFFSRNPRGGASKDIDIDDFNAYLTYSKEHNIITPLCHAPYTLNPWYNKEETRAFAVQCFEEDFEKLSIFNGICYNFHPGSHVGQGEEIGITKTIEVWKKVMKEEMSVTVLLETMSCKCTEIG